MAGGVVTIERVVAGGAGLARDEDGRVVFVDGALPGEAVTIRVVDERKDFARADVVEVLEPSPARVVPPCPHLAEGCGGCSWQHVEPAAQLALKVDVVRDALRRTAGLPDAPVRPGGAVPAWGYRTSLRLAVAPDGRLGLRRARRHDVVALDDCPVAHPLLSELLGRVRATGPGEVALRVGAATGEATALTVEPRPGSGRARRSAGRRAASAASGLPWDDVSMPAPAPDGRGPSTRTARGAGRSAAGRLVVPDGVGVGSTAFLDEDVAGARLRVSAPSFFQSGPAAAGLLVATVGAAIGDQSGRLVDAYGGVGLFGATVAAAEHEVVLVESSPSACADARVNLAQRRATVVESRVEAWAPQPADAVVADPARAGLQRDGAAVVAATGARRIVLVSCDPVSLARDATLLARHGYALRDTVVLDLFPHTPHVEAVTVFEPC
ncbi:MAG: TRAM domain-containing protein [Ilumatobacteraceae bacterium]